MAKSSVIGPGQYEIDKQYKSVLNSSPGYHFSNDQKLRYELSKAPGPGSYDGGLLKSHKSIRIGEKVKDLSKSYVPGPGVLFYFTLVI